MKRNEQNSFHLRIYLSIFSLEIELNESAEKTIVHEPKVRKVMVFGFMALQSAPEEIVKQLIAFLVVLASQRLGYFD